MAAPGGHELSPPTTARKPRALAPISRAEGLDDTLAKALPSLVWFVFRTFMVAAVSSSSFSALTSDAKLELAVAVFECGFALVLMFKAGSFASLVVPGEGPQADDA